MNILIFELDGQRYGLPTAVVVELLRAVSITPLAGAPEVVGGVINVRGVIVPVIDMRSRLKLAPQPLSPSEIFIVVRAAGRLMALRVDAALDLAELAPSELQSASDLGPGIHFVASLAKWDCSLVLVHDLATYLNQAEQSALTQALASGVAA